MRKLSRLLPKEMKQLQLKFDSSILGAILHKNQFNISSDFRRVKFFRSFFFFVNFTIGMIGKDTKPFTQICGSQQKMIQQM